MKNFVSFGFSFLNQLRSYLQTLRDRFYFRMQGRYSATHITLTGRQWASILENLEQSGLVELLSVFSGNGMQIFDSICGAVPNKDVSMFLSMLRSSSVCDAVMPL